MSAIREVKYLRELHHQNIIEVKFTLLLSLLRLLRCWLPSFSMCSLQKQI